MIGERIRNTRISANMTQEQLAKISGLRQFHISRIEMGHIKELKSGTLVALAHALKVSTDYLLGLEESEAKTEDAALATV